MRVRLRALVYQRRKRARLLKKKMDGEPATNLSEVEADSVKLWSPVSKTWVDVRVIVVAKTQITSPVEVVVRVADESDTHLVYPNPTANQVPALDGILAYIAQQKLGGAAGVTNKYFSVKRKNYSIFEGDSYTRLHGHLRPDLHSKTNSPPEDREADLYPGCLLYTSPSPRD